MDKSKSGKVGIYFHLSQGNYMLTGAGTSIWKKIWCDISDESDDKINNIKNVKITELDENDLPPLAIAMVMDHSGSMGDSRARTVQKAANKFINEKNSDDKIALIRYDAKVVLEQALSTNNNTLTSANKVNGLKGFGSTTASIDAAIAGVDALKNEDNHQKVVFVFTDGMENASKSSKEYLTNYANKHDVIVCAIDYGYNVTKGLFAEIAEKTNGIYHHIYSQGEFDYVFKDLYNRLNKTYFLELDNLDFGEHNLRMKLCLKDTVVETNISFNLQPIKGEIILLNVYFDTAKFSLKKNSKSALDKLERLLRADTNIKIEIHGHTDNVGDDKKNMLLSQKRADAVKAKLVGSGIDGSRIATYGWGESKAISDNNSKKGRAKNRRTEFVVK